MKIDCDYRIKEDIGFLMEAERMNLNDFSKATSVSRMTLNEIKKTNKTTYDVLEKVYSYAYENNYRINSVKEEILKENNKLVLFHGSKFGLNDISIDKSRDNCDFGKGFYLGETYNQALSFILEKHKSSVYSFVFSLDNLKIKRFDCDLDWMLTICYYRKTLGNYNNNIKIKELIKELDDIDLIISPIADNKMFYIMSQFTEGEINADVALHSLSASKLGLQYVLKTNEALKNLKVVENYFICEKEREECRDRLNERAYEIDTKLKLAKREFRNGLYIEEILK